MTRDKAMDPVSVAFGIKIGRLLMLIRMHEESRCDCRKALALPIKAMRRACQVPGQRECTAQSGRIEHYKQLAMRADELGVKVPRLSGKLEYLSTPERNAELRLPVSRAAKKKVLEQLQGKSAEMTRRHEVYLRRVGKWIEPKVSGNPKTEIRKGKKVGKKR